jgi:non-ribosomal peptide synthase protein (TIGR01720 family)
MIPSVFVTLDEMPLTANGKVNRRALPAPDSSRPQLADAFVAPRTPAEITLAAIWSQLLRVERVGVHDNFFELGGDSILSIQIVARAQQAGLHLTPKQLFQHQTIAELAAVVGTARAVDAEQGQVSGAVALTPIQHWFFAQELKEVSHYNQALMLEVREGTDAEILERAVREVMEHHDALRMRYERAADGVWRQENLADVGGQAWWSRDLSGVEEGRRAAAIEEEAERAQRSLEVESGTVMRVVHMDLGGGEARLLMVVHHLVMDGVSWRVVLEDLVSVYEQLAGGAKEAVLAAKTTSYRQWAERLGEYALRAEVAGELDYWLRELRRPAGRLKIDYEVESAGGADEAEKIAAANTVATMQQVHVALNAEETQALLTKVPSAYRTQINEALMAALATAYGRWSGEPRLLVELEGHGREEELLEVDLSRTVGWFTTIYPLVLEAGGSDEGEHIKSIKEHLRAVPHDGLNYGVLRYLGGAEIREQLAQMPSAEVSFNYLGQLDQVLSKGGLLRPARESSGLGHSPDGKRPYLIEISGGISGGRLQLAWIYSSALHRRESIEKFAGEYIEALRRLIAHCQHEEAGGFTPSDFPEADLSQKELDELVAELDELTE